MHYYSTKRQAPNVSFREGVVKSLPPDNGLYFPEYIPNLSKIYGSQDMDLQTLAFETLKPFVFPDIPKAVLGNIVEETFDFEIPLVPVADNIHSLELFHGPTYAFKDVGARFLARCLGFFNRQENKEITILVATSGDTGAVASGFLGVEGVKVVILYPKGKVSGLQEKQLTTLGQNIIALEIEGDFDQCQSLVKEAFLDDELNHNLALSSANSINIARWIPQSIYFGWSCFQGLETTNLNISVPSGNYGNLAAGLLAKRMGAPIKHFTAASNANDVVPRYLETGDFQPRNTITTYANAMDVGNPSNFPRILALHDGSYDKIQRNLNGFRLSDEQILKAISECWQRNKYLLDPHGAIGYKACQNSPRATHIFLETAHPCKFDPVIRKVLPDYVLPEFTQELMRKSKTSIEMEAHFDSFKEYLLQ